MCNFVSIKNLKNGSIIPRFILSVTIVFLAGCAATSSEGIQNVARSQGKIEAQLNKLSEDIEELKTQGAQRSEKIEKLEQTMQYRHEYVEERLAKLEGDEYDSKQRKNVSYSTSASGQKTGGKETGEAAQEKKKETAPASPAEPEDLYSKAMAEYRNGNYKSSILTFEKFINANPQDGRVPDAYLNQGMALINLGKKSEAKVFFETLIDRYPGSEEAETAKNELNQIP